MLQTTLPLALFLSSRNKARAYIADKYNHEQYLCLVSLVPTEQFPLRIHPTSGAIIPFSTGTVTLQLFRVFYPHRKTGEGWGEPVPASSPHRVIEQPSVQALLDYLYALGLAITDETVWEPIEEEEG